MQRTVDVTTARRQFGTLLDEVFYQKSYVKFVHKDEYGQ